jgi:signal transduction histidine kinase
VSAPVAVRERAWTLRTRLGSAFVTIGVVLLVVATVAVLVAISFTRTTNAVIYRWQRGIVYSTRLLTDLVNEETGLRGYALTRDVQFLQPYEQYSRQYVSDLARVRGYVHGDAALERRLHAVEQAVGSWRTSTVAPDLALVRGGRSLTAVQLAQGKAGFDAIRARLDALTNLFIKRSQSHRHDRTVQGLLTAILAGFGLLLVLTAGLVLWRGLHRWVLAPVTDLAGQVRGVASGDTDHAIQGGGPVELTDLGHDVEAMRQQIASQLEFAEAARFELARSNEDLQQFAYVASHDLSEPLRKIANFCQLLERQYAEELDDRAKQYIHYAVDGAKRMQALITDLLALSRVGRNTEGFERINLDLKLDIALQNLSDKIAASDARIERLTPLPTVDGDRALLTSLLENLVGNAIKYRRPDVAPVVRIGAEVDAATRVWTFTISDNGIGIDPQFAERVFAVFQRLHLRSEYEGTGIGLALCRRIVEFHGGRIWLADVESENGATFRFTLPESRTSAEPSD